MTRFYEFILFVDGTSISIKKKREDLEEVDKAAHTLSINDLSHCVTLIFENFINICNRIQVQNSCDCLEIKLDN